MSNEEKSTISTRTVCPLCGGNLISIDGRRPCSMCDYVAAQPVVRRETPADRLRRVEAARAQAPARAPSVEVEALPPPTALVPVHCPVDDWPLARLGDDEPRILVELGRRLGYSIATDARQLVRRMLASGKLSRSEVVGTVSQASPRGGRPAREFWLTEEQALLVATQSETAKAWALTREIVRVFRAARAALLAPVAPPLPAATPAADDRLARIERILERLVIAQAQASVPKFRALPRATGGVFLPIIEASDGEPAMVSGDEIHVLASGRRAA